ncbi:MAG: lipase family protein [Spirosomataceae bacterium]
MKKLRLQCVSILLVLVSLVVFSCKTNSDPNPASTSVLVSSTLVTKMTKAQISDAGKVLYGSNPLFSLYASSVIKSNIKVYRIVYNTTNVDKTSIKASGLLIVPDTTLAMPLVSYQHGTITSDAQAPSYFSPTGEVYSGVTFLASSNYIFSCPDYLGYGESKTVEHPYQHRETLAQASLDMLRASKEFLTSQNVNWNKKVMLTGYSEGGFATMALQKKMEEQYASEFNLVASTCGAGAYNTTQTTKDLLTVTNPQPLASANSLYLWVLTTYNRVYGLNRAMSAIFKEPYATDITAKGIAATISVSFNKIFLDTFVKGVTDNTDTAFLTALKDNDIYDWKPTTPMILYHGKADEVVSVKNTEAAQAAMKARGVTDANLQVILNDGKTHASMIQDYLLGTYLFFSSK